jgi:hypothetical protein
MINRRELGGKHRAVGVLWGHWVGLGGHSDGSYNDAMRLRLRNLWLVSSLLFGSALLAQGLPSGVALDAKVGEVMAQTGAKGMAVAVIDHGKVTYVRAFGVRNARGEPLTTDTVMYGASLTKTVFAYTVMQLVDAGKLKLDTPLAADLDRPLPSYGPDPVFPDKYGPYKDLADDPRLCCRQAMGRDDSSNAWHAELLQIIVIGDEEVHAGGHCTCEVNGVGTFNVRG